MADNLIPPRPWTTNGLMIYDKDHRLILDAAHMTTVGPPLDMQEIAFTMEHITRPIHRPVKLESKVCKLCNKEMTREQKAGALRTFRDYGVPLSRWIFFEWICNSCLNRIMNGHPNQTHR
jgi:hypothetical protein